MSEPPEQANQPSTSGGWDQSQIGGLMANSNQGTMNEMVAAAMNEMAAAAMNGMVVPREQDRFLPVANITRIMREVIPPNAKIAKDAKDMLQEAITEFVAFITSEAVDRCEGEKRRTVNTTDILNSFHALGFDPYVEPLTAYLEKMREEGKKDGEKKS